jgi:SynChlorMet cassette radical SAM/SPASM protein ScmE
MKNMSLMSTRGPKRIMSSPRSVEICITGRCNLRCLYCSYLTSAGDLGADLPTTDWLRFIDELGRCGVMSAVLSGGEPLVRRDIREIIDRIVRNRMRYSILTNGTLVTDGLAAFIASTRRCDSVQVSVDGSGPATHDACRGEGNFRRAMDGIACLQRHGIPLTVRVTIHKDNVADLDDTAKLLLEDLGLPEFSTNSAGYLGICRQNADRVQLSTRERCMAMESLLRLSKKYPGRINATAGPLADARCWLGMELARREGREGTSQGGRLTGCDGAREKLAVRSDGVIIPCQQLSNIELGRINEADLREVWLGHPELKKLRERDQIPLSRFEGCQGCGYAPYCTGNCPALAYTLTGDAYRPSPDACLRRFLEDGGTLPEGLG